MDKIKCEKFKNCVTDLLDFTEVSSAKKSDNNIFTLEIIRVELNSLWDQVKKAYFECRDHVPQEGEIAIDKTKLRTRYREAMEGYKTSLSSLNEEIQIIKDKQMEDKTKKESGISPEFTSVSRLPPCDTDTFKGGYTEWPTFRDLFSAIYIQNTKLSNVEKLFHLTQKTTGEAREIIRHVPLTNDGFELAWRNLTERYENKRMQVNEQIKIPFNLPNVTSDSSCTIQKLQRTVNSCLQILETLDVDIKVWDPILIYLCSTKLHIKR